MAKKPKTEDESLAEIATSSVWLDAAMARAAKRLARENRDFAIALISEVLKVADDPKRFIKHDKDEAWFDMGGTSALALVKELEEQIRIGTNERREERECGIPAELIREEMEDGTARALKLVDDIAEARRQCAFALERQRDATEKLALLLSGSGKD